MVMTTVELPHVELGAPRVLTGLAPEARDGALASLAQQKVLALLEGGRDRLEDLGLSGSELGMREGQVDRRLMARLTHTAGNFYINDKPTGAVVGQQPFGGSRKSGTNDKAGSMLNLYRWLSPRTIKENFNPPLNYRYPLMERP